MIPSQIQAKRNQLQNSSRHVRWCDDHQLDEENAPGVSPGGYLNPFSWYVIGTTAGGHAIVVSEDDPGVYFADYTWYDESEIDFQDYQNNGEYVRLELNAVNLRRSLFPLAASIDAFLDTIDQVNQTLNKIG